MVPEKEQKLFSGAQKVQVCAGAELFVRVVTVRTVRRNAVVLVTPPPVAVTVIGKVPPDVAAVVATVNIVEQLRLQAVCEKDPVAPDGKPATEKETCWLLPETKLTVMVFVTEDPALTDSLPWLESAKPNDCVMFLM